MPRAPSDRILNHVVMVYRKAGDCDDGGGYGEPVSGEDAVRCGLRPLSEKDLILLGFEVTQPRMKCYFRDNLALRNGDKVRYEDAAGNSRYVYIDRPFVDEKMMGRLFSTEGADHEWDE